MRAGASEGFQRSARGKGLVVGDASLARVSLPTAERER